MRFKFKMIAAAAALALSSAASFAAGINTSTTPDLIFVAWDGSGANTAATYVRDLGALSSIGANNVSFNAPTASIFTTQFTGVAASNIYWNVFAVNGPNYVEYMTGSLAGQTANITDGFAFTSTIDTALSFNLTNLQAAANGYVKANGEFTGTSNQGPTGDGTNGFNLSQLLEQGLSTAGHGVGKSQNFLSVDSTPTITQLFTNALLSAATDNTGGNVNGGYFTLTDAQGDVTWTGQPTVAAVPLPAAALLFGPGLLGLFGAARRRRNS